MSKKGGELGARSGNYPLWTRSRPVLGSGPKLLEPIQPALGQIPKFLDLVQPGLGPGPQNWIEYSVPLSPNVKDISHDVFVYINKS